MKEPKVIGIGGIFFKSSSPQNIKDWYQRNLGINTDAYGASFVSRKYSDQEKVAFLQWSPFPHDTKYFDPSDKPYMINYRVQNLEALIDQLKANGVTILDEMTSYDYGKFVHILDADGTSVELWEPIDGSFDQEYLNTANTE